MRLAILHTVPMPVFTVMSQRPNPELWAAIEARHAGKFMHWSDRVSFIEASGTAQAVAEGLGVKSKRADGTVVGTIGETVVLQAAPAYWGWTSSAFWTWLTSAFQRSSS